MVRALVIGDTDLPSSGILDPLVAQADLVVAADGGANRALKRGIDVDWVIGDLDGILPSTLALIPKNRIRKDRDPDHTDLEKVMAFLVRRKVKAATLTGVVGGRLDHTLGTLAVLSEWGRRLQLEVVDENFVTTLVEKSATIQAPPGTMVSLFAPQGAQGVSTRGLRFPLKDRDLGFSSLGIHNEVSRSPARITVRRGPLFVLRSHRVRPHL